MACSSAKVYRNKYVPLTSPLISGTRVYSEFWEAAENLQINRAVQLAVNEEQKSLVQILALIQAGETDRAITLLEPLQQVKDPRMAKAAGVILKSLLASEARWSELAKDDEVAKTLGLLPQETYSLPDQESVFKVDFKGGKTPLLEVDINGVKRKFFFDTGCSITVVSSELAKKCGLEAIAGVPRVQAGTSTRRRVDFKPTCVDRLAIGNIVLRNHPAIIIESKALKTRVLGITFAKIDGILGWNAIRRFRVVIDYPQKTLSLSRSTGENPGRRNYFYLGFPVVHARASDGTPVYLGFDSGAKYSLFHINLIEKLQLKGGHKTTFSTWGVGGFGSQAAVTVPAITLILGDSRLTFRNHKAVDNQIGVFARMDGILGNNLTVRKLILDYPAGQFSVE